MSVQQALECVMQMLLVQIQLALISVHVSQDLVAMELFVMVCKVVFHIVLIVMVKHLLIQILTK